MRTALAWRESGTRRWLRRGTIAATSVLMIAGLAVAASAAPGVDTVAGVTTPFNGAWLDSTDGGHYWDAGRNGLCRVDKSGDTFVENTATCDGQAKAPTQVAVGPERSDGTYFLYVADMSTASAGPVRVTYDPTADGGQGRIVAGSGFVVGGLNTVGFYSDATGPFQSSSVALGPCDATITTPQCTALYVAFERSKRIERINFVDQPLASQSIETISKTNDIRKGVRYGIATFRNADGTTDLYIDELGGEGVSTVKDIATCQPSEGAADPTVTNPPVNQLGGCAATVVSGITTNFAQGIAVQDDADGTGRYLYVGDSPENASPSVLRYHPGTGFQDVVSSTVAAYDSRLNPGQVVTTYTGLGGLAVNPHNGDLFIGDDPTIAVEGAAIGVGHIFTIAGDSGGTAPADCTGSATNHCVPPAPPSTVTPSLYADGVTAPAGGLTFLPSSDGGHMWLADESSGFCRFDVVSQAPGLHASDPSACDDGTVLGSGGQSVYDDSVVSGTTDEHYVYVAQNDHLSPGVVRFTYDPTAKGGAGGLVGTAVIMAPGAGLNGDRANGLALGPCKAGAPSTCKHSLYVGGLLDGFIRRINNPEDDPRNQTVDVVAETTDQKNGNAGRGINGSIGVIGNDLYLPEDSGFTVVRNITACPTNNLVCPTIPLNIGTFGSIFGAGIGVDANPLHSVAGLVYASDSPGSANATIYQYDVATNTSRVYATRGQMPPADTAEATVYCTLTCTRPDDPADPPGSQAPFKFAQGLFVDPNSDSGTVYIADDATAGARGARGHVWAAPFIPYPSGVTPVPFPGGADPGAHTCAVTVPVPTLATANTYWVQFTAHDPGVLSSTWQLPVAQSAQLLLYANNPFTGLADPVAKGPLVNPIVKQATTTTAAFAITTAPTSEAAGTYTVQFFNAGKTLAASHATITYSNDAGSPCPASPLVGHVVS
ncbi:MAG TPA: hypothetical protein VFX16_32635 [Pseudonocardiaceae bacterium]|nr:hypothetical protein [Pseudonocardiaceae bacterium]